MLRCLFMLFISVNTAVYAAPDAGTYVDIENVRLYRDNESAWIWYISPANPKLDMRDGPGYALDLFRYLGRSGTGDKDHFWTRGILTLHIERSRPAAQLDEIKKQLRRKTGGRLSIKSLPISGSNMHVNFADVDHSSQQAGRWQGGVLQMALDDVYSQLLWNAESSLLSLSVTETTNAVRMENNKWEPASIETGWTVDVPMSQQHTAAYRKNDLTAQLGMAYNEIDVFCFDFMEQTTPGLYAKEVEIGFQSGDRPLLERARFDSNSDYRLHIRFPLAKSQKEPLRYRIIETYNDGRRETGGWKRKQDEYLLDITAYNAPVDEVEAEQNAESSEPSGDESSD